MWWLVTVKLGFKNTPAEYALRFIHNTDQRQKAAASQAVTGTSLDVERSTGQHEHGKEKRQGAHG
jgi:hypothetical protein